MQKGELRDTVTIEPRTSIVSFDSLVWQLQKVVSGAIAGFLYGDNEEGRKQFFHSATNRKNKQRIAQLASQVYGYLNSTISEHSDVSEYAFRVWTRVEIERQTGEIVGEPTFDVDFFRYLGRVSAKPVTQPNQVEVVFVGAPNDEIVSPHFARLLKRAKSSLPGVSLQLMLDLRSVGQKYKARLTTSQPFLFVGSDQVFPITMEALAGTPRIFIGEGAGKVEIKDEEDLLRFLVEKAGTKPEILGTDTAFQPVDQEVRRISAKVSSGTEVRPRNLLDDLRIGESLETLEKQLSDLKQPAGEEPPAEIRLVEGEMEKLKRQWVDLKSQYEAVSEEMTHLREDLDQKRVTYDTFSVERFKSVNHRKKLENDLVELQEQVRGSFWRRMASLFKKSGKGETS